MILTRFQDDYFLWYDQSEQDSFFAEPRLVSLYFPKSDRAFACWFKPDNLCARPPVRRQTLYGEYKSGTFYVWDGHVFLSDCCTRGVTFTVRKLMESGQFEQCFKLVDPPSPRWSDLRWTERVLPSPALEFKNVLAGLYANGLVEMLYLEAADHREFDECMRFYPCGQSHFVAQMFRNPIFAERAWIAGGGCELEKIMNAEWHQEGSPFHIAATFASKLFYGGAYSGCSEPETANQIAHAARDSLWGDNFSSLVAWSSSTPWSSWFYDVAWDWTFAALDPVRRTITCLMATDTD